MANYGKMEVRNLAIFRITYTFDKENELNEFVDATNAEEALSKVEPTGIREFSDEKGMLHRVNLDKVTHISVFKYEKAKPMPKIF
jgi:hypothetical protein